MPKMNRINLNDRMIKAARVEPGRATRDYFDANVPGLVLRVTSTGRKTFYVWYRDPTTKKPRWVSVRDPKLATHEYDVMTLDKARDIAREIMTRVGAGKNVADDLADQRGRTFGVVAAEYVEKYARVEKASWQDDRSDIRTQLGALRDRPIADITRREIRSLLDGIVARGAKVRANRIQSLISGILTFAVDREYIDANPALRMKPTTEGKRSRRFGPAEIRAFWQWANQPPPPVPPRRKHARHDVDTFHAARWRKNRALLQLRLLTLARANELLAMKWTHIDWSTRDGGPWWTQPAETTKNGHPNRIPLVKRAIAILRELQDDSTNADGYVFAGIRGKRQRRGVVGSLALAEPWLPRDLRRTGTTNMAELGVPRFIVDRILNHVDDSITGDYDYYAYGKEKRDAFDKWAKKLDALVSGPPPRLRVVRQAS